MKKISQKIVNFLLVLSMICSVTSGLFNTAYAEQTSVEIVSFVRGTGNGLRSSELLEARVTGYDGNLSDLTFTWDNQLGTYLYIYNSSNMYNIKDTAGEIELDGRSNRIVWEGIFPEIVEVPGENISVQGYAWAAVYGAKVTTSDLKGGISVTVTDKNGNIIGSSTYEGPFLKADLSADLEDTNYGVFEGETINIKDMLGRSSIVHIDCVACTVNAAQTSSSNITLSKNSEDGNYYVKGNSSGIASVTLSLKKGNCKFHYESGMKTITNNIYVFKKPNTSTTTTTMVLTNIDSKCEYFIGHTKGTLSADGNQVVFENLTPDTTYEVTVRGDYGEGYAYAYVTDTTKSVFKATVNCYTDNSLADFLEYFGVGKNLFIKEKSGNEYISLTHTSKGVYTAVVDNGIYYIYYKNGSDYTRIDNYQITIDNANSMTNIHTYSVKYSVDGVIAENMGGVYYTDSAVYTATDIPQKSKSAFLHWVDKYGNKYKPGQLITARISEPTVLTAVWEDAVDVKVNITIDHSAVNGGVDRADGMHNVQFRLNKSEAHSSVPASDIVSLSQNSCNGYNYSYEGNKTIYTSNTANFEGSKGAAYTISSTKSGYDLMSVNQTTAADGTITLDVLLRYQPNNFDLNFDVVMDKTVPAEFYPAGVNVKVTFWGNDSTGANPGWYTITQHASESDSLYVELDNNGKGSDCYPVWKTWSQSEAEPYYYSVEVVSYVLKDGSVVTNTAKAYKSTVTVEGEGACPVFPVPSDVEGAYFDAASNSQKGVPTATISIESFNLTFNANGGTIKNTDKYILNNQVVIPDLLEYVPTREGGYKFTGWYTDSACTNKVASGDRLYDDTTLYAGWKEPLSISGTITVEGFYYQDGILTDVLSVDRARSVITALEVKHNGTYNDVMSVTSNLVYDDETDEQITNSKDGIATVEYNFENIPDELAAGVEYRIKTTLINYQTLYDNNSDAKFTSDEHTAVFATNNAKVDAYLKFDADEYEQKYEIDATQIGEGFRPQTGITQLLFDCSGTTPPNTVISQHTVAPYGEEFAFAGNGIAKGSVNLWKGISNGAISVYQLLVKSIDNSEYNSDSTYSIRYGATSNWNVASGSAGTLKATLVPNEYMVKFDLNTEDEVGNMDDYISVDGDSYFTTHKWSHDTPIAASPTREGYIFAGWEAEQEGVFDGRYVDASVAEEITLKAKWSEFRWTTDTDSGYVETEDGKKSVVRFLFDVITTDELRDGITQTGIKFIKSNDISGDVENSGFVGADLNGSSTTFYGDIVNIPESNSDVEYYAIAYVICNDEVYWSLPVECGPDFDDLILYE